MSYRIVPPASVSVWKQPCLEGQDKGGFRASANPIAARGGKLKNIRFRLSLEFHLAGAGLGTREKMPPLPQGDTGQNFGAEMGNEKGNVKGFGKGTFIDTEMVLSPAFLSLGVIGTCDSVSSLSNTLLLMFLLKRKFSKVPDRKGTNKAMVRSDNNEITMTYTEIFHYFQSKVSITQPKITRAIDELLAKGFIRKKNPGGCYERDKAIFELVDDWKLWRPGNQPVNVRNRDVRRGFQGKGLGAVRQCS